MVPVATLPAAAILMGVGYWIEQSSSNSHNALAALLTTSGLAILDNMPALFAIGIAYGMSKDKDGAAALTGFIGFLVVTNLCAPSAVSLIQHIPIDQVPLAFQKIKNPFIGILVGVCSAEVYNRYSHVELPKALSFFSGRRLVPILVSFLMIAVAFILMYIWPLVFNALVDFGIHIQKMGAVGAGIYAFFNRILIAVGLHHALNAVFWFDVAGINDIPNFLGGAKSIADGTGIVGVTGRYQAGFFPVMMFGLPGAALAIWQCARPENRAKVGSIMLAAAFASFFTGITEPLEFSFMFVAPVLFVIHAVLTGLSVFIAASMHWISGFGFSAGLVDMILSSRNPLATHWYMLIPQGLAFFVIYYVVFRFTILKFDLKTPGREPEGDIIEMEGVEENVSASQAGESSNESLARRYIAAVGGTANLTHIDACITRLRLSVADADKVNDALAKKLGASGVLHLNKQSIQIVIGTQAEAIAEAMKSVSKKGPISAVLPALSSPISIKNNETVAPQLTAIHKTPALATLVAPVSGEIVPLEQVPDAAFSSKAVGDGIAINPTGDTVVAPLSGTIVKIFATNHAFCLESTQGAEIIVHMGIDTVALEGRGFERLVEEGADVEQGQPILKMDLDYLSRHAPSMISPIVISNSDDYTSIVLQAEKNVVAGQSEILAIIK
ncbi:N-acetylglucosamine-specific PTS transporter subunit IIBC [Rosenbergiella australiborealis]